MNDEPKKTSGFLHRTWTTTTEWLRGLGHQKREDPWAAKSFDQIQRDEWWEIRKARDLRRGQANTNPPEQDVPKPITQQNLVGLAFSGGGIRSATLNLGILQGLAKFNLLQTFDYLSGVSGGNYIASWLAAWIKREGFTEVSGKLSPDRANPPRDEEAPAIRWLREYSNYLTPRMGLASGDAWAAMATYFRNLLLNQTILVLVFGGVLLLPRVLTWAAREIGESWDTGLFQIPWDSVLLSWAPHSLIGLIGPWVGQGHFYFVGAFLLLTLGVRQIHNNMTWFSSAKEAASNAGQVFLTIVVPFIVASWALTVWLWYGPAADKQPWLAPSDGAWWHWMTLIALLYTIPWLLASWGNTFGPAILGLLIRSKSKRKYVIPITAPFAGAFGGILLWRIVKLFHGWNILSRTESSGGLWQAMSWGTPLVLLTMTLMAVLHIGLMGTGFQEGKREWWSRLGGYMLACGLAWATLFGFSVYGPMVVMWMGGKLATGSLVGWIATTAGGVLGGKSAKTDKNPSNSWLGLFLKAAPVVFIAGLLLLVSFGVHVAVVKVSQPDFSLNNIWHHFQWGTAKDTSKVEVKVYIDCPSGEKEIVCAPGEEKEKKKAEESVVSLHWKLMNGSLGGCNLAEMLLAFLGVFLLAWRVDINEFSMHLFYRNRLARCYLGASRKEREPTTNPFTGFSPKDDLFLATLSNAPAMKDRLRGMDDGKPDYAGPYLLVNTALNLTSGQKLAWQSRKARSFTFSPRYCGFEVLKDDPRRPQLEEHGYRETLVYAFFQLFSLGGPLTGTAMGISGAAASPNMGYHSSAPLAFLMTVFNVRLGMWLGNPRHRKAWQRYGPKLGLPYLFNELAGMATDERKYVYLSDGGHFENLGVYELVRRRCKYIVACDASADPKVSFDDLGNAIEKCRVDFGVDIEIDVDNLKPPKDSRISRWHCAVGRVRYKQAFSNEEDGIIVYLKSSLTGDEPADVRHYSEQNTAFPHTSTGNQFFDESQFESYRELGYHIITTTFGALGDPQKLGDKGPQEIFEDMQQRWRRTPDTAGA